MGNRIDKKFSQLRRQGKKALIAFITAGDPDLQTTAGLVLAFEKAGVDIVELGVPFSDPLADGPTIQAASQRALLAATTIPKIFDVVKQIRKTSEIPLALMTYYNPVFHFGQERFIIAAKTAGVDAVIIPDLPPEEAKCLIAISRKEAVSTIFFVSPTTTDARSKKIADASTGFIYYVSLTGVTGAKQSLSKDVVERIKRIKRITVKPVCVGFGVSTSAQVKAISAVADGVIVGSAIIKEIEKNRGKKDLVSKVAAFVRKLHC